MGDGCDNCIHVFNPGQENDDGDNTGNLCDPDIDNDGVGKCRYHYNEPFYDISSQFPNQFLNINSSHFIYYTIHTQLIISRITVYMSQMVTRVM